MSEEPRDARLKRLNMRSMRRGIKEMDLILMAYSEARLRTMSAAELDRYDSLLSHNDQDLYQWVSGQRDVPASLRPVIEDIRAVAFDAQGGVGRSG